MGYLAFEEQNAEMLHFFLWFCGYVSRWSQLPADEKMQSPPLKQPRPKPFAVHSHRRADSERFNRILDILDETQAMEVEVQSHAKGLSTNSINFSIPRYQSGEGASAEKRPIREAASTHTYAQPFRREIQRVVRHYLRGDAPRRLQIPQESIAECLDALQETTHPSALLPAFMASEAVLKSEAYPRFLRSMRRNANRQRLIFIRCLAALVLSLGVIISVLLLLPPIPIAWRAVNLILWWPGLTILIASVKGVCLFLHLRHLRQLRPWEQRQGREDYGGSLGADQKDMFMPVAEVKTYISSNNDRQSTRAKIWGPTARIQNPAVRILQGRTVLLAVCWGGVVAGLLTLGTLWIPSIRRPS